MIIIRSNKFEIEEKGEQVIKLRNTGKTYEEIGKLLNAPLPTVAYWAKRKLNQLSVSLKDKDLKTAEIWNNLDLVEKEAWKKYDKRGSQYWLNTVIRVQIEKIKMLGLDKAEININNIQIEPWQKLNQACMEAVNERKFKLLKTNDDGRTSESDDKE